jgi:hypothetical protein
VNAGKKVLRQLVVARGDGAELFQLAEEVFDQMARLVELDVERPGLRAGTLAGDHCGLIGGEEPVDHPGIGIERLVGDQGVGGKFGQEGVGAEQIVRLAGGEQEADRVTERIDQRVDLRAQPAFAAADRLVFAGFFCAPALC